VHGKAALLLVPQKLGFYQTLFLRLPTHHVLSTAEELTLPGSAKAKTTPIMRSANQA
jgi:hypothetical protein